MGENFFVPSPPGTISTNVLGGDGTKKFSHTNLSCDRKSEVPNVLGGDRSGFPHVLAGDRKSRLPMF